jgi:L-ascorbate metabolism protein UlaG (beta-lactamase superfamily)
MEVIFIGNEGVLVRTEQGSVMIDALFGNGAAPYATTSPQVIDAVESGRDRFGDVDVVLATHYHPDHFNPRSVVRYLDANPGTQFLSTPQCAELIDEKADPSDSSRARVHAVNPDEGVRATTTFGDITVHAFGLSHGKVRYADVEHLGLLVELGSLSLLHLGDGIIDHKALESAGVFENVIDACFLPFWYYTYPVGRRVTETRFRGREFFGIHIPPPQRPEIESAILDGFPDAIPLVEPLSTYTVTEL